MAGNQRARWPAFWMLLCAVQRENGWFTRY